MRLTISIVVYKSNPILLESTLQSLNAAVNYAKSAIPGLSATLCIIENESVQRRNLQQVKGFIEHTQGHFDCVDLQAVGANLGYGRGHNLAIDDSSDFHLVLNPDVSVSETALCEGLSYFTSNPQAVLLTPKVLDAHGGNLFPCKRYPALLDLAIRGFAPAWLKRRFDGRLGRYEMRELAGKADPVSGIEIASGCYMLTRTAAMAAVGGFDERFFLYFEDFDLSLRLNRVGELVYLPSMEIAHYGGNTAKKGLFHIALFAQSAWKFYQCHGWRWL